MFQENTSAHHPGKDIGGVRASPYPIRRGRSAPYVSQGAHSYTHRVCRTQGDKMAPIASNGSEKPVPHGEWEKSTFSEDLSPQGIKKAQHPLKN